ncbi:copper chaperone PCu(A)C [Erythrobacter cryptus]|uniref:copper chaperone PCu(A)C n=1 Tax=Erythrobacter cryptus TaxID=196588 RepID=UPI00041616CC|nr:copper chaperone PCu(A)C [Erythrobacter cryptus]
MRLFPLAASSPAGAGVLALLAACAPEAGAPEARSEAASAPAASPAPAPADAPQGLAIANPRIVLSPVAGNPAALYFDLSYRGAGSLTLDEVTIEGAGMTMIHQTIEKDGARMMVGADPVQLSDGVRVSFSPGGLHVMAMQPAPDWKPGQSVMVTLRFADGTTHSFAAPLRAAGEAR